MGSRRPSDLQSVLDLDGPLVAPSEAPPPTPAPEPATAQPPTLATERHLLERVASELAVSGVAGEGRTLKLLYLVVTSRLLGRPCSVAVKGPSAGGKSFIVDQVLRLFPPSAYYALTAMSDKALAYDTEPLVHRMLVLYEAEGSKGDTASYLIRSLLSEGRLNYVTVDKTKAGLGPRRIDREGPTGLITTTTAVSLHPENETRLLSLTITDSPAQTREIMRARALGRRAERDRTGWHDLQTWLAALPSEVEVPFATTLADAIPPVSLRLRRDFPALLTLIEAHAVLHQHHRERDTDGRIIATFEDYATVRELVVDIMADGAERSVSPEVRATVRAVGELTTPGDLLDDGVPNTRIATMLGIDKSTALRRVRVAINRGFLLNLEPRPNRPARLVLGEPLPEDSVLLPGSAELERLHGCDPNAEELGALADEYPRGSADEPSDADPADSGTALSGIHDEPGR